MFGETSKIRQIVRNRKKLAGKALYISGLSHIYTILNKPTGAVILMYHSVAEPELAKFIDPPNRISSTLFEQQIAFLSKYRRVISLSNLIADLRAGRTPPSKTVCITFDDGYLDNFTTAAPILARYKLPATLYLPTAYIDRAETQWADTLYRFFSQRTKHRLVISSLSLDVDLSKPEQLFKARAVMIRALREALFDSRQCLLKEVEMQLQPEGPSPRLTMNWNEVRELTRLYPLFEIGGHSRHHTDLNLHRGDTALDEIVGCAKDLHSNLGLKAQHFSFPYSRWNSETYNIAKEAGWMSAVGLNGGPRIGLESDTRMMSRIETPTTMTELKFVTSAGYPGALSFVGK